MCMQTVVDSNRLEGSLATPRSLGRPFSQLDITELLPEGSRIHLCEREGRFWVRGEVLAQDVLSRLKPQISALSSTEVLLIDFCHVSPDQAFLTTLLKELFFPKTYDGQITDRFVRGKKVLVANPDNSTLIGMSQCLDIAHTHCMVIRDLGHEPWELTYAGHIEPRLIKLLESVRARGKSTVSELVADTSVKTPAEVEKAIGKMASNLKELYDYSLIDREAVTVEGQSKRPYQYSYFHPYQLLNPEYRPQDLFFTRAARPPRAHAKTLVPTDDEPEPPPSKQSVLDLSVQQRECLYTLTLFPNGCSRHTLLGVLIQERVIRSLVAKGAVSEEPTDDGARYHVLEPVRSEAITIIGKHPSQQMPQLAKAFTTFVVAGEKEWTGRSRGEWVRQIKAQLTSIGAVIEWCAEKPAKPKQVEEGLKLAVSLSRFWEESNQFVEGISLLTTLLEAVSRRVSTNLVSEAQLARGILYNRVGKTSEATRDIRAAQQMIQK